MSRIYHHLSPEGRAVIMIERQNGNSLRLIARRLGRSLSTLSSELQRMRSIVIGWLLCVCGVGNASTAEGIAAIEGEQKTAPLHLTFEDLSFEIEGLPLSVRRSYDSLKRLQDLDFGHGWSVDYQEVWGGLNIQVQHFEVSVLT